MRLDELDKSGHLNICLDKKIDCSLGCETKIESIKDGENHLKILCV